MGILPIGFFAPLPLAIMIPFMAAQSFAMGHAFGTSFQYGKRKISSMTNEEFNALSATDLHGELQADIRAMIPNMNQSFKTMETFQIDIINSMVNTLKIAAVQFFEWITTGRVTSGGDNLQTDTSATNIDFSGGVFDVQGGSRQDNALTTDNPRSDVFKNEAGQTYEEWVAANTQGTFKQIELNKSKLARDVQRSRDAARQIQLKQKLDTSVRQPGRAQFKSPAEHAATKAANKQKILINLRSAEGKLTLKKLELKRFVTAANNAKRRGNIGSVAYSKALRSIRIIKNEVSDLAKKVQNIKTILRNFR